jgi:asparagine synthase (glutamine-hydrolysing)
MCGICGIARSPRSSRSIDRDVVTRMRDVISHRGPDGAGVYTDDIVGLGHRRLSIVDVAHGAQPMASDDGSIQLIYNGEVYNHPALSERLIAEGVRYNTRCDTETILRLYERHRRDTPRHLRGMFAFAIWDRKTRELFITRDRFGVKPVYYALTADGTLVFASEIKAILASEIVRPALNERTIPDFLANHAPSGDETMFAGIRRLPPGHWLLWKDGAISIERYWDLSYGGGPFDRSEDDLIAEYRERFIDSVRMRLMADVPLGMFLSGGIDSAAITAAMSTLVDEPIKTFSVAFAEREANELAYARLVAERYRTDHHEIIVSPEDFFGALPRLVWHEDEPIAHPSSIALNFVSRLAAEHVKVVLTGEGSDETLAGYNKYRVTVYNMMLGRRYEMLATPLRSAVKRGIEAMPTGVKLRQRLSRTFLAHPADLTELYFDNFAVFGRARQATMLTDEARERVGTLDPYAAARRALEATDARTLLDQLLYVDTKTYLHELLMKQDQMSMAESIESRVPFLDHELVEFASRLPQRLKLRGLTTKYVLRQAMKDRLPAEILSRKKMGFPVPIGSWFRGAYRPLLDEYVLGERATQRGWFNPSELRAMVGAHVSGEQNHAQRLWALLNFELWQRIFLEGEPMESIRLVPES